jgi:hypothetical protein
MTSIEGESSQQKHNSKLPSIGFSYTVTGRSLLQHDTSLSYSVIMNRQFFRTLHVLLNINNMEQFRDLHTCDWSAVISIQLVEKVAFLQLPLLHGNDDVISINAWCGLPSATHKFNYSSISIELGRGGNNMRINKHALPNCCGYVVFPIKERSI